MTGSPAHERMVVGWREWCSLPDLGLPWIKAKVDTGARTSTLHAFDLQLLEPDATGRPVIRFCMHPLQNNSELVITCEAPVIDERRVTDSGGHSEMRYVILSAISLGEQHWPIELTLTSRDNMRFRMLLGRTAMENRIRVDPAADFVHGRPPRGYRSTMRKAGLNSWRK